jgi:hypothetical protein
LSDEWHSCRAAGENHFLNSVAVQIAVAQSLQHGFAQPGEQRLCQLFELRLRELATIGFPLPGNVGDRSRLRSQLSTRTLALIAHELIQRRLLLLVRHFPLTSMAREDVVDHHLVEVLAAQPVVAGGRAHFDDPVEDFEDRNVEGTAAQIEHEKARVRVQSMHAVCKRRGSRLVQQTFDAQAGQLACSTSRLTLLVVEVGRNGDDRLGHCLTEERFGIRLQTAQHYCRKLFRQEMTPFEESQPTGAHVPLEGSCSCERMTDHAVARSAANVDRAALVDTHR